MNTSVADRLLDAYIAIGDAAVQAIRPDVMFVLITLAVIGLTWAHLRNALTLRESPINLLILQLMMVGFFVWLLENWPHVDSWDIEIVGSDIDVRALNAAQEGVYSERSLMRLSRPLVAKYFTALDDGRYRIDEALRGSVRFSQVNIIDQGDTGLWRDMDVIFCRNVLIYFDQPTKGKVLDSIAKLMPADGVLYLGGAETVLGITERFKPMDNQRGLYVMNQPAGAPAARAVAG